jgi:hypothetical protein
MRYFFNPSTLCFDRKDNEVKIESWTEEVTLVEGRAGGPSYEGEPEPDGGWPDVPPVKETVVHSGYTRVMTDDEFFGYYSDLLSATELTEEEFYGFIDDMNYGEPKTLTADENGRPSYVVRQVFIETLESILAKRKVAYTKESDPLKNEAEYDAIINGTEPDYTLWIAKVAEIKQRYPIS